MLVKYEDIVSAGFLKIFTRSRLLFSRFCFVCLTVIPTFLKNQTITLLAILQFPLNLGSCFILQCILLYDSRANLREFYGQLLEIMYHSIPYEILDTVEKFRDTGIDRILNKAIRMAPSIFAQIFKVPSQQSGKYKTFSWIGGSTYYRHISLPRADNL